MEHTLTGKLVGDGFIKFFVKGIYHVDRTFLVRALHTGLHKDAVE